jgi:hypothetical protein
MAAVQAVTRSRGLVHVGLRVVVGVNHGKLGACASRKNTAVAMKALTRSVKSGGRVQGKCRAARWHGCPAGVCAQKVQAVIAILRAKRNTTCTVQVLVVASRVRFALRGAGSDRARRGRETGTPGLRLRGESGLIPAEMATP